MVLIVLIVLVTTIGIDYARGPHVLQTAMREPDAPVEVSAATQPVASSSPVTAAALPTPLVSAVATFGDISVSRDEAERLLRSVPPQTLEQLRSSRALLEQWLRARLAEKALVRQADAQGWRDRPEVRELTDAAIRQIVARTYLDSVAKVPVGYPSKAALETAYERAKANFAIPATYRLSQIFLAAPASDVQAVAAARKQAADIGKRANASGADFGALAKQYSQDANTADQGGDTGLVPLSQLLPEMRSVVAAMKPGEVSAPVQSTNGIHILKLTEMQPSRTALLAEVQGKLIEALRNQRRKQVAQAYLDDLLNAGTVSIDGASLNAVLERVR